MKPGIHPDYVVTEVTCTCGETFTTRSTAKDGVIHAAICSSCHPFYIGTQKILETGGRADQGVPPASEVLPHWAGPRRLRFTSEGSPVKVRWAGDPAAATRGDTP